MSLAEVAKLRGKAIAGYRGVWVGRDPDAKVISCANYMLMMLMMTDYNCDGRVTAEALHILTPPHARINELLADEFATFGYEQL